VRFQFLQTHNRTGIGYQQWERDYICRSGTNEPCSLFQFPISLPHIAAGIQKQKPHWNCANDNISGRENAVIEINIDAQTF
jgi:hypothetical protein